ncbi:hypothetical protein DBV08_21105 [Rhodococcus sp. KBW08]|nr:hypothetical protein DBV08_21105 [Rhodococcus sp. KBW08]
MHRGAVPVTLSSQFEIRNCALDHGISRSSQNGRNGIRLMSNTFRGRFAIFQGTRGMPGR